MKTTLGSFFSKKILLSFLLTAGVLLQAEDFDSFIGLQVGSTNLQYEESNSQSGGSYGIRLGFIKDTGRVYLTGETASIDDADLNSITVNFDAITPRAYKFNDSFSIRGFVGVHGGYVEIKPDNLVKDDGAVGGGQAGILLDFPANITLEIGYKASWPAIDYANETVKNYQNAYLAFDFVF
ncbi:MAG: hypothetical protein COA44_00280 [Arcobacter sp.]|nr:MAG: hypothetical protein COA44_00280 [Arcobacter sp.]